MSNKSLFVLPWLLISFVLVFTGLSLFIMGGYLKFTPEKNAKEGSVLTVKPKDEFKEEYTDPVRILAPSAGIDVEIIEGGIKDNDWILSEDRALYLPTSGKLGEGYNTVIYAHKRPGLFLNLRKLSEGDKITLLDSHGKSFVYKVYSLENVAPSDVDKLKSEIKNNLTIFTCDGNIDETRVIVKAKIEEVSN